MSVADIREKFLKLNSDEVIRYNKIVDRELSQVVADSQQELADAELALTQLQNRREDALARHHAEQHSEGGTKRPYALAGTNPVAEIDAEIVEAEAKIEPAQEAVDAAEEAAASGTVSLVFGKIDPDEYDKLLAKNTNDEGELDMSTFNVALAAACYRRTELDGEDLGISWDEARKQGLTHGDRDAIYGAVIAHNREVTVHPSLPRRSGK